MMSTTKNPPDVQETTSDRDENPIAVDDSFGRPKPIAADNEEDGQPNPISTSPTGGSSDTHAAAESSSNTDPNNTSGLRKRRAAAAASIDITSSPPEENLAATQYVIGYYTELHNDTNIPSL